MSLVREFMARLRRLPESEWQQAIDARKSAAYSAVFATPEGEIVLQDLLREGGLLASSVVEGDAYATHRKEGRRELALHIVHRLSWSESQVAAFAQAQAGEAVALASMTQEAA